jgi:ADP-heptose:LPS heptosyltransferase
VSEVYTASTMDKVFSIVKEQEKWSSYILANYVFLKFKIVVLNLILNILRSLWFKRNLSKDKKVENIVVYSVGILGDNIVRLPAIIALKKRYPNAKLIVINKYQIWSPKPATELFSHSPFVDEFISIQYNPVTRKGLKIVYDSSVLGDLTCDLFVNLSPLGNRGWFGGVLREIILAKKLGAKYVAGFKLITLLNDSALNNIKHRFIKNTPRFPEEVLKELEIDIDYDTNCFPIDKNASDEINVKLENLGLTTGFAILHPGSKLDCQKWPTERFAEVANYLFSQYGLKSIVTGVESENTIAEEIISLSEGSVINFAGKTALNETVELIRRAKIVISNDTGIMHMASILNKPTIGIFGTRLSPTIWWPLGKNFTGVFAFSESSFRYNDEPDNSNLLLIETNDITQQIDVKLNGLNER